jgi:hypothetical protein
MKRTLFIKKNGEEFYKELNKEQRRQKVISFEEVKKSTAMQVARDPMLLFGSVVKYKRCVEAGFLSFKEI